MEESGGRQPLISDSSVLDISTSFRAATARQLRRKYRTSIEQGGNAQHTQSVSLFTCFRLFGGMFFLIFTTFLA